MFKHIAIAVVLGVLALPALAQQPNTTEQSVSGFVGGSAGGWRGSKLIGASVYGPDNASIGEIGDMLIAPDGKIRALVVSVGGFLGTADKDIAIPFQALSITRGPAEGAIDKIKVSYSKQQIIDAPRFAFDQPPTTTTGLGGAPSPASPR